MLLTRQFKFWDSLVMWLAPQARIVKEEGILKLISLARRLLGSFMQLFGQEEVIADL